MTRIQGADGYSSYPYGYSNRMPSMPGAYAVAAGQDVHYGPPAVAAHAEDKPSVLDKLGAFGKGLLDVPGALVEGLAGIFTSPKKLLLTAGSLALCLNPVTGPVATPLLLSYGLMQGGKAILTGTGQVIQGAINDDLTMIEDGATAAGGGAVATALSALGARGYMRSVSSVDDLTLMESLRGRAQVLDNSGAIAVQEAPSLFQQLKINTDQMFRGLNNVRLRGVEAFDDVAQAAASGADDAAQAAAAGTEAAAAGVSFRDQLRNLWDLTKLSGQQTAENGQALLLRYKYNMGVSPNASAERLVPRNLPDAGRALRVGTRTLNANPGFVDTRQPVLGLMPNTTGALNGIGSNLMASGLPNPFALATLQQMQQQAEQGGGHH